CGKFLRRSFRSGRGPAGGQRHDGGGAQRVGEAGDMTGRLIGVGTGPGDPELLTLKAVRAIGDADVIAHFLKRGRNGNARGIVAPHWPETAIELPLAYPVTTELDRREDAYKAEIAAF